VRRHSLIIRHLLRGARRPSVNYCQKDLAMITRKIVGITLLFCASFASLSVANAKGLTREQVVQQLIDAQQNGSMYVTDASYPDVSPIYQQQVDQLRAAHARKSTSGIGPQSSGTTESGNVSESLAMSSNGEPASHDDCVGPVSFCKIYFGN
jgi:hypothetical protein